MFTRDQYELIDFGEGRKLERFGKYTLDRPFFAAERSIKKPPADVWASADARFDRDELRNHSIEGRHSWSAAGALPQTWTIAHGGLVFELRLTRSPNGQVGIFPEQAANWDWIRSEVRRGPRPFRVLNLFAYTGGSTLAAAAAGAEVTHVDSSTTAVHWARRNAELSRLDSRPIHWITDDAPKYVQRELRRGKQYEGIVLDPPSYGHGTSGEAWGGSELPAMLRNCAKLLADQGRFLLLTSHTARILAGDLLDILADACRFNRDDIGCGPLALRTREGRKLPAGAYVRWTSPDVNQQRTVHNTVDHHEA